jgi:hypothetical protein
MKRLDHVIRLEPDARRRHRVQEPPADDPQVRNGDEDQPYGYEPDRQPSTQPNPEQRGYYGEEQAESGDARGAPRVVRDRRAQDE